MCGRFILFVLALCACCLYAQGAEQPEECWFLVSETELRSIEVYKQTSEQEKQSWLLQVQSLQKESASLNNQLASARELQRNSEQSWNEYEAEKLAELSMKNGEIANLTRILAEQALETEKYKGIARSRLIIIIAIGAVCVIVIAFKVYRFLRGKK